MLVRRGARVQRVDPATGSPMAWHLAFDWRGRTRALDLAVTRFDRPEALEIVTKAAESVGLTAQPPGPGPEGASAAPSTPPAAAAQAEAAARETPASAATPAPGRAP